VTAAVERGEIAASRYRIYLELFEELSRKRW
jgi:putative ribosome biogenesis GTPase RsgA